MELEEKDVVQVFCPFRPWPGHIVCHDAMHDAPGLTCAWWIPGAECCALVQIARKLSDMSAMRAPYLEGIGRD